MGRSGHAIRRVRAFFLLLLWTFGAAAAAAPARPDESRVIRVGWYDYAGFFMVDESGHRSGYAYDYLQEIARYGGWSYEYVNGTVAECLQMLEDGQIDLMGCVMHSAERDEIMCFPSISLGKNYSVLTTRAEDTRYRIGDSAGFDGLRVGALRGDLRLEALRQYAGAQGFTYRLTEYDTPALMEQALSEGRVDALLTTNMRVSTGKEQIIAQFAPKEFYPVTSKGNESLMRQVEAAMEQIEYSHKGFQSELSKKYFSVDMSGALAFTEEELAFVRQHPRIRVVLPAPRRPMAYEQGGKYDGIVVDVMNEIAARIGVTFDYLPVRTQLEGVRALAGDGADMIANVYDDYGWAEANQLFLTRPYTTLRYAAITRIDSYPGDPGLRVAAVTGYRFSADYVERLYPREQIAWYDNETDCVEAVRRGERDICFVSTHVSDEFLSDYRYRNLNASMTTYSHGLSAGVAKGDKLLVSLVDKAIASMGEAEISNIVDENTMVLTRSLSFGELVFRYPLQFTFFFGSASLIIMALVAVLLIYRNSRRKDEEVYRAQLAAERDSLTGLYNRLAFETVVTQRLQERTGPVGGFFVMLDVDNFKQINDLHGHGYGDQALSSLAEAMRKLFAGHGALLCRMGGDEFALFFPRWDGRESAVRLLEESHSTLTRGDAAPMPIPCSLGAAFVSERRRDFSALYKAADEALYLAKREGRGTVRIAPEA